MQIGCVLMTSSSSSAPCTPANVDPMYTCASGIALLSWDETRGRLSFHASVRAGQHVDSCTSEETHCAVHSLLCGLLYDVSVDAVALHCNSSQPGRSQIQTGTARTLAPQYPATCRQVRHVQTGTARADRGEALIAVCCCTVHYVIFSDSYFTPFSPLCAPERHCLPGVQEPGRQHCAGELARQWGRRALRGDGTGPGRRQQTVQHHRHHLQPTQHALRRDLQDHGHAVL